MPPIRDAQRSHWQPVSRSKDRHTDTLTALYLQNGGPPSTQKIEAGTPSATGSGS